MNGASDLVFVDSNVIIKYTARYERAKEFMLTAEENKIRDYINLIVISEVLLSIFIYIMGVLKTLNLDAILDIDIS